MTDHGADAWDQLLFHGDDLSDGGFFRPGRRRSRPWTPSYGHIRDLKVSKILKCEDAEVGVVARTSRAVLFRGPTLEMWAPMSVVGGTPSVHTVARWFESAARPRPAPPPADDPANW